MSAEKKGFAYTFAYRGPAIYHLSLDDLAVAARH
jgi:hypothetical protein